MIFVLGATGKVGRALVPALLDAGAAVRALTRDPAKARIDPRADVVRADLETADLPALLDGAERVFVLTQGRRPRSGGRARRRPGGCHPPRQAVHQRCPLRTDGSDHPRPRRSRAGGPRSRTGVDDPAARRVHGQPVRLARLDPRRERRVRARGRSGLRTGPRPGHRRGRHAHLTTSGHEGATYELTGGEALTTEQQVEILAEALGRPVKYVEEPLNRRARTHDAEVRLARRGRRRLLRAEAGVRRARTRRLRHRRAPARPAAADVRRIGRVRTRPRSLPLPGVTTGGDRMAKGLRVLVVDDHPLFRFGVCTLLDAEPGIEIVGEAASGATRSAPPSRCARTSWSWTCTCPTCPGSRRPGTSWP